MVTEICAVTCGIEAFGSLSVEEEKQIWRRILTRESILTAMPELDAALKSAERQHRISIFAERVFRRVPLIPQPAIQAISDPKKWAAEVLLRFSSEPGTLAEFAGTLLAECTSLLRKHPLLVSIARFSVLQSESWEPDVPLSVRPAYKEWSWTE